MPVAGCFLGLSSTYSYVSAPLVFYGVLGSVGAVPRATISVRLPTFGLSREADTKEGTGAENGGGSGAVGQECRQSLFRNVVSQSVALLLLRRHREVQPSQRTKRHSAYGTASHKFFRAQVDRFE